MSYEPTLIISKSSLHLHKEEIEVDNIEYPEDRGVKFVFDLLKEKGFTIKGIELILCKPELTTFNREVRQTLFTYGIEYAEDL